MSLLTVDSYSDYNRPQLRYVVEYYDFPFITVNITSLQYSTNMVNECVRLTKYTNLNSYIYTLHREVARNVNKEYSWDQ